MIARRHEPTGSFKRGHQRVDAGVDADKERLSGESYRSAVRAVSVQSASIIADGLRREECHLKIYNLLLLGGGWPGTVPLGVVDGGVNGLVR